MNEFEVTEQWGQIRVEAEAQLSCLDDVSRRKLGEREGDYQLLPAPRRVMLMRRVSPGQPTPPIRLAGEIVSPGSLCDIFSFLAHGGFRGELSVTHGNDIRTLFFDAGKLLGAETNVPKERLGAIMYRYGAIDEAEYQGLEREVTAGGRVGALAVQLDLLSQEAVFRCLRHQVREIAFATLALSSGTFCFLDGFNAMRLVALQAIPVAPLVMDGVTRMDELEYFRRVIPSADYVPVALQPLLPEQEEEGDESADQLRAVLAAVDGKRSVRDIGRRTERGEFAVTKALYQLSRSGHVSFQRPGSRGNLHAVVEQANRALRALHNEAATGEMAATLRESLASFALGAGVYPMLFEGAGPAGDGSFDAGRLLENLALFHADDAETLLRQMLHDYASFALFSLGGAMGPDAEVAMAAAFGSDVRSLNG